jgi:glycosyltransferase involved in cell wall biosynthesis
MFRILKMMRENDIDVTFVSLDSHRGSEEEDRLNQIGIRTVAGYGQLQDLLAFKPQRFEKIVVSRPDVAQQVFCLIRAFSLQAHVVYDTVDLHFLRFQRESEFNSSVDTNRVRRYRGWETHFCQFSDEVWVVSSDEKLVLKSLGILTPISIVSNIHAPHLEHRLPNKSQDIVFLGNFDHSPNRDAVIFFLEHVFPKVLEKIPAARFLIVGDKLEGHLKIRPTRTVRPLGFLPDVSEVLLKSRLMVVPLRFGAGVKGKVGMAGEYGLPVVTTTVGAEGMGLQSERSALIADEPEAIAHSIIRLIEDDGLWSRLSQGISLRIADSLSESAAGAAVLPPPPRTPQGETNCPKNLRMRS